MYIRYCGIILFFFGVLLFPAWSVAANAVDSTAAVIQGDPLVLHFDNGKTALSEADKDRIKALLKAFNFGPEDKLLLVGHTDSAGDSEKNLKLSYDRARTVRREIIGSLGINGKNVLAMGRGEESPV